MERSDATQLKLELIKIQSACRGYRQETQDSFEDYHQKIGKEMAKVSRQIAQWNDRCDKNTTESLIRKFNRSSSTLFQDDEDESNCKDPDVKLREFNDGKTKRNAECYKKTMHLRAMALKSLQKMYAAGGSLEEGSISAEVLESHGLA